MKIEGTKKKPRRQSMRPVTYKEKEYSDLKAKSDLVSKSFDQVTKKIETIEQDYGVAQDIIESLKLKIHQFEEKIINIEVEKARLLSDKPEDTENTDTTDAIKRDLDKL